MQPLLGSSCCAEFGSCPTCVSAPVLLSRHGDYMLLENQPIYDVFEEIVFMTAYRRITIMCIVRVSSM